MMYSTDKKRKYTNVQDIQRLLFDYYYKGNNTLPHDVCYHYKLMTVF